MLNGPFYALLAYMILRDGKDVYLTRSGLRSLTERRPAEPRQKTPAAEPQNGAVAGSPWPAGRRTG